MNELIATLEHEQGSSEMKHKLEQAMAVKSFFEGQLENVGRRKREVNLQI